MKFFTADDFERTVGQTQFVTPYEAADIANTKLERDGKVVYGQVVQGEFLWNHTKEFNDTHTGLLICIEEIEKPKCEHVPTPATTMDVFSEKIKIDMNDVKCAKCGIKLKATWEVVE